MFFLKEKLIIFTIIATMASNSCLAQQYDTVSVMNMPIQLDTFVVKSGFDIKAFIRRVQNDTTFYKAFKSMHLVPFTSENNFTAFDKRGVETASLHSITQQNINGRGCRTTVIKEQKSSGDFFKKDSSCNYYTAELFFSLFFSKTPVCNQSDIVGNGIELQGASRMEKNKYELKQLMFNPGSKVGGVPFMGNKASVFDDDELYKYNFVIRQETYEGTEAYVFSITPKPEYISKVVYNELTTWFRVSDYSILARDYSLSYNTLFYDFDVHMKVRTKQIGNKLYPTVIHYDGNWHVFSKKREHLKVDMSINY